jgi:hypothetical protein
MFLHESQIGCFDCVNCVQEARIRITTDNSICKGKTDSFIFELEGFIQQNISKDENNLWNICNNNNNNNCIRVLSITVAYNMHN